MDANNDPEFLLKNIKLKQFSEIIRSQYIYKEPIERVYDAYTQPAKYDLIMKDLLKENKLLKGTNYAEVGTLNYIQCAKTFSCVNQKVVESINTSYFKKVVFDATQVSPFEFKYQISYTFYWDTVKNKTLFFFDFLFEEKLSDENCHAQQEHLLFIMKKFDLYLKKNTDNLFQEESILINSNLDDVWKIITNWNLFSKFVPDFITGTIVYDGHPLEKDTKLHVYLTKINSEYHMKVVSSETLDNKRVYKLCFYAGVPKSPKQDLVFTLININNNACFLIFRHEFKQYVNINQISKIKVQKLGILTQLKENIEKRKSKFCIL